MQVDCKEVADELTDEVTEEWPNQLRDEAALALLQMKLGRAHKVSGPTCCLRLRSMVLPSPRLVLTASATFARSASGSTI